MMMYQLFNFRALNGAVRRLATPSNGGRITTEMVKEEILRLEMRWDCEEKVPGNDLLDELLGKNRLATLDRFDRVQLADVITICRKSRSLSEAGRELFAMSRKDKQISNDAE